MRNVIGSLFQSLDGVIQAPGGPEEDQTGFARGGWVFPYFDDSLDERMALLRDVTSELPNVEIDGFRDLLINYMAQKNAHVIVRGLRAVSDFEYELQLASANHMLSPDVETFFMMTSPQYSFLSSSIVKEIAMFKGPIADLVPPRVETALRAKYE